jgi:hypothetical protein
MTRIGRTGSFGDPDPPGQRDRGPDPRQGARTGTLAATVETWWPHIVAFLHTGITNAGSEGTKPGHQDRRP